MPDVNDMTKGQLREEVLALRKLVSEVRYDCYSDWEQRKELAFLEEKVERPGVNSASCVRDEAIMTMIDEYRKVIR